MKLTKPVIFLTVFVILLALACTVESMYYFKVILPKIKKIEAKLTENEMETKQCEQKQGRIKCIQKTLIVAYGLSKWESYYYAIMFDDFSTNYDIPWEIYAAIVRIESNFKCNLTSSKGAKGMWQLKEATAKEVADGLGIEYVNGQTLWNGFINFILGATYLSKNIKQLGIEGGVKSYLGGPDYLKSIQNNEKASIYISEYKTTVWKQYKELVYIFRGVVNEADYQFITTPKIDSLTLDVALFTQK